MKGKLIVFVLLAVAGSQLGHFNTKTDISSTLNQARASQNLVPGGSSGTPKSNLNQPQELTVAEQKNLGMEILESIKFNRREIEIHEPDASFIKVHFSHFKLPKGVTLEIRSPDGEEFYRYSQYDGDAYTVDRKWGDDGRNSFSAMSISGDTAIIEVQGDIRNLNSLKHRVSIDYYMAGLPHSQLARSGDNTGAQPSTLQAIGSGKSVTKSLCGIDNRVPAICFADSHAQEFDRSWPVARLLIGGTKSCTAWRVGSGNRLFTNNHCVSTQEQLETVEVWFNYQESECGDYDLEPIVKVSAANLLAVDQVLDYALFTVNDFASIEDFGHLGLDVRDAELGEQIYIPQHGSGYPKQIAIESDMNINGLCQVDDTDHTAYGEGTDIGYYCDSKGGSSGSPVIASSTDKVIALHHFGGCVNSGVKMSLIWPQIADFFGGQIPQGDQGGVLPPNELPNATVSFACDELNCTFSGAASFDPDGSIVQHLWNFGDGNEAEGLSVVHNYSTTGTYPVSLTVVDNDNGTDVEQTSISVQSVNQPPLAVFEVACTNLSCEFSGATSTDTDGVIQTYRWSFGDGQELTSQNPIVTHDYPAAGSYVVELVVTDDRGAEGQISSLLNVAEPVTENIPPQASFAVNCTDNYCEFDAGTSFDTDGSVVSYGWNFGDNAEEQTGNASFVHTYQAGGTYQVQLEVTDDKGATAHSINFVTVVMPNTAPVAEFSYQCDDLSCSFDASSSLDPDGVIHQYAWTLGDGNEASGSLVGHVYAQTGVFEVSLTVSDNAEASSTSVKVIEVIRVDSSDIALTANGSKFRGAKFANLEWAGADGARVEVYRDGSLLSVTDNDGFYLDDSVANRSKEHEYQVCETETSSCSDKVVTTF